MMLKPWLTIVVLALTLVFAERQRILFLSDRDESYFSSYIEAIRSLDYEVIVRSAIDDQVQLESHGEFLYDHLIIAAPKTKEFGGRLSPDEIVRFLQDDKQRRGLLIVVDNVIGDAVKDLCGRFGVKVNSSAESVVVDHFENDGTVTNIRLSSRSNIAQDVPDRLSKSDSIVFVHGNGLEIQSELASPFLFGNPTSFIGGSEQSSAIVLAARVQSRSNNARVAIVGSTEMVTDAYFYKGGNSEFLLYLTDWILMNVGNLQVTNVSHRLVDTEDTQRKAVENSTYYIVSDKIEFSTEVTLTERNSDGRVRTAPFCASDMQLELVRLDPFIRTTMECKNGRFHAQLTLPDTYGVFKFVVDYERVGLSKIHSSTLIPIRPKRHDQYRRFIPCALPYYATCLSVLVATLLLGVPLLFTNNPKNEKKLKTE
ncbi:hypothetical protein ACOME3_004634 [Neoechinorhynchus agilis]